MLVKEIKKTRQRSKIEGRRMKTKRKGGVKETKK